MDEDEEGLKEIEIPTNEIIKRKVIFETAAEMIDPIIEHHGLDSYRTGGSYTSPGYTTTKVDQHIAHIIYVANWLQGKEDG